jgi:hypothetical protein
VQLPPPYENENAPSKALLGATTGNRFCVIAPTAKATGM